MDTDQTITKRKPGQRLVNAERMVLIGKIVDELVNGYISTYALSKKLKTTIETINTYRPLADKIIADQKIDRNVIRNLQIKRTYQLIEELMKDLKNAKTTKDKSMIYSAIYKFSSHLALITGLNVETHVNIDPTKLVIIRSNQKKTADRVHTEPIDDVNSIPATI